MVAACIAIPTTNPLCEYDDSVENPKTVVTFAGLVHACRRRSQTRCRLVLARDVGGSDESRLSIYQRDKLLGIYDLSCDLTDVGEGSYSDNGASLDLVRPESNPEGLLVVGCNVGAHSRQITIIDLTRQSKEPVFSATGSYTASWEIQDGELWIGYDEPCDTGPTVECPDGYETRFVQYPDTESDPTD